MNKSVIAGVVLLALAGGGYYQFVHVPEQARIAAEEAAKKAAEEAAAAAKAAEEAAAAEAKAAEEAAAAAARAAEEAAAAAAAAATEAATAAVDAATGAATDALAALDPANFDATTITGLIDASALDEATKATLKTAVTAAASNPALVAETVAQVKAALGL